MHLLHPCTFLYPLYLLYPFALYGPMQPSALLWTLCTLCTLCTYSPLCVLAILLHSFAYWKLLIASLTISVPYSPVHPSVYPLQPLHPSALSASLWTTCNPLCLKAQICILKEDWLLLLTPFQILNFIQSLYCKLGLLIIKVPTSCLNHVPKSSATLING